MMTGSAIGAVLNLVVPIAIEVSLLIIFYFMLVVAIIYEAVKISRLERNLRV